MRERLLGVDRHIILAAKRITDTLTRMRSSTAVPIGNRTALNERIERLRGGEMEMGGDSLGHSDIAVWDAGFPERGQGAAYHDGERIAVATPAGRTR